MLEKLFFRFPPLIEGRKIKKKCLSPTKGFEALRLDDGAKPVLIGVLTSPS